jgi:hypothetical protein
MAVAKSLVESMKLANRVREVVHGELLVMSVKI